MSRAISWCLRQKWRALCVVLLLALLGVPIYYALDYHFLPDHYLRKARESLEQERIVRAERYLNKALKYHPSKSQRAEIELLQARADRRRGRLITAKRHLNECYKLMGAPSEAHQLETYMLQAQLGEIATDLRLRGILEAYVEQDKPQAEMCLEAIAWGLMSAHRYNEAHDVIARWTQRNENSLQARFLQGTIYEEQGNYPSALQHYTRAIELDPERDDIRARLGRTLVGQGHYKDAIRHLEMLRERVEHKERILLSLAQAYRSVHEYDKALNYCLQLVKEDPSNAEAFTQLGLVEMDRENYQTAAGYLRQAYDVNPNRVSTVSNLAACYREIGAPDAKRFQQEAEDLRKDMLRMDHIRKHELARFATPNADLHSELGRLLVKRGELEQGLLQLNQALAADDTHQPTHLFFAKHYLEPAHRDLTKAAHHQRQLTADSLKKLQDETREEPKTPSEERN